MGMASEDYTGWDVEPVEVVPHRPEWAAAFEEEAGRLRAVIGHWITGGVHHVGSTAVSGLDSKPIIDIAVGVQSLEGSWPCIDLLGQLQYRYAPYRADVMHWLCKPDPARRTHHLHLIPTGSPRLTEELAFRDCLRDHPEEAAAYALLKRRLAAKHSHDREAYTAAKTGFIASLTTVAQTRGPDQDP